LFLRVALDSPYLGCSPVTTLLANSEVVFQAAQAGEVTADELVYAEDEGMYYRKRCAFFNADVVRRGGQGEAENDLLWIRPEEAAARLRHESQRWAVSHACGPKPVW